MAITEKQRRNIAYKVANARRIGEEETVQVTRDLSDKYETSRGYITRVSNEYWTRWHYLVDKHGADTLTETERREYNEKEALVKKLEREEVRRLRPIHEKWMGKHNRIIGAFGGLTEALLEGNKNEIIAQARELERQTR